MQQKGITHNEKLRRAALAEYAIFDSGSDKDYDQLTFLAASIFNVPVAKICLVDKNVVWNKSVFGAEKSRIPRQHSFSEICIRSGCDSLVLHKADQPEIFEKARDYEGHYEFFAGVCLCTPQNHKIGVFAIFDENARSFSKDELKWLEVLANQCMNLLESRKQKNKLQHVQRKLKQKYKDLERFSSLVSHDIKSPLANIISLTELLKEENEGKLSDESLQYLEFLVESSYSLRNYVDGILSFYRSDHVLEKDFEDVHLPDLLKKISDLYNVAEDVEIEYPSHGKLEHVNKAALTQVFMNLVSNALKYNKKDRRRVEILFRESDEYYHFQVKDNGNGIKPEKADKIFNLFTTLESHDRDGVPGSGIGLATVKKHVVNMKGDIEVISQPGQGSTFKFKIKRS